MKRCWTAQKGRVESSEAAKETIKNLITQMHLIAAAAPGLAEGAHIYTALSYVVPRA